MAKLGLLSTQETPLKLTATPLSHAANTAAVRQNQIGANSNPVGGDSVSWRAYPGYPPSDVGLNQVLPSGEY